MKPTLNGYPNFYTPFPGNEDAIEVYTPERPYTIYTQTKAEKSLWLNKLRETIYQHLREQDKCKPDEKSKTGMQIKPVILWCIWFN